MKNPSLHLALPPTEQEQWLRVVGLYGAWLYLLTHQVSGNPQVSVLSQGECQCPSVLQEVQPSPTQGSTPPQLPSLSPSRGKCNYGTTTAAGKGQCGTDVPAPHQPSLAFGEQPSLAKLGKRQKIEFCFSTVCWVFIDQTAAGVSIRVTRRELDQELLSTPNLEHF